MNQIKTIIGILNESRKVLSAALPKKKKMLSPKQFCEKILQEHSSLMEKLKDA